MKDIGEELKISQKVTSYTTRHTFATILKHLGVSTSIISEQLGHDEATTVQIYLGDHEKKTIKDSARKAIKAVL